MPDTELYLLDALTGNSMGTIPVSGSLTYGRKRNDVGTLSADIPFMTLDPQIMNIDPFSVDDPPRVSIYVVRDGVPLWGGLLWKSSYDDSTEVLTLSASEFWSYFAQRLIYDAMNYDTVDTMELFQDYVNYAQGKAQGNIRVQVGSERSGQTVSLMFTGTEGKTIQSACTDLSSADPGFDFAIDVAWDTTQSPPVLTPYLRLALQRGVTQAAPFTKPGGIISYTITRDASTWGPNVFAQGQGSGSSSIAAQAANVPAGYPTGDLAVSYKDVSDQTYLNALAMSDCNTYNSPVVIPAPTVRADVEPILGTYDTGDWVPILIEDARFPRADWLGRDRRLNDSYRLEAWTVTVADDGSESVALTLGESSTALKRSTSNPTTVKAT